MINTACSAMIAKAAIMYQRYCSHNDGERIEAKLPGGRTDRRYPQRRSSRLVFWRAGPKEARA